MLADLGYAFDVVGFDGRNLAIRPRRRRRGGICRRTARVTHRRALHAPRARIDRFADLRSPARGDGAASPAPRSPWQRGAVTRSAARRRAREGRSRARWRGCRARLGRRYSALRAPSSTSVLKSTTVHPASRIVLEEGRIDDALDDPAVVEAPEADRGLAPEVPRSAAAAARRSRDARAPARRERRPRESLPRAPPRRRAWSRASFAIASLPAAKSTLARTA